MEELFISAKDGYQLSLSLFEVENPKGYVQLLHGMEEHKERYNEFASALNEDGYTVLLSDMRGHGETAPLLGYFNKRHGDKVLIDDYKTINEWYRNKYNLDKVIMFAHSMGTINLRNLMLTDSKYYSKVIMSGYPSYNGACPIAIFLGHLTQFFKGAKADTKLLNALSTGAFNNSVKNPRTSVDWLSYNEENVDKYIADPLCGFPFKVSALKDLFHLMNNMHKYKNYVDINDMPILMLSGKDDPCTGGEKGRLDSINTLKKAGFSDIQAITYDNARHELLNEDCKNQVTSDIIEFLNK